MCDQDHFEKDRQEYEARGLVTRREFGMMMGAGMAMMLPQVQNAVAVTESEVTVKTPDGTADCYFVHPTSGTAPAVLVWPDIFGLRPSFRQMGKRLAESGHSVLVVNPFYRVKKAPTADAGAATPIPAIDSAGASAQRNDPHERCESIHCLARPASVGCQKSQSRYPGILHGRTDCLPYRGSNARSRRRRCFIPWRRSRDDDAEQSASSSVKDQGAVPCRHR